MAAGCFHRKSGQQQGPLEHADDAAMDYSSSLTHRMAGRRTVGANGIQLFIRRHRRDAGSYIRPSKTGWRVALLVCPAITLLVAGSPVFANEFDPLLAYEEARALNDQWQACAASFVREKIHSRQYPEILAKEALERCKAREDGLSSFLVTRVGRTGAGNVMALLLEKYRSGLAAAIMELRTRH
ncbi:hypothetical protein [Microvirga sp. G4-2]|uniref:hypothetical protein n=1 Tax=Microvirga sp. G4-2 TaxID=3434467 RepID=UPI0040442E07